MIFKPIDEMSLRHLFSTEYASNRLKLEYIGPVLNNAGKIVDNPDAIVLDKRKEPYKFKRCEFKFSPSSCEDFSHNNYFEIAIIWTNNSSKHKKTFEDELRMKHNCHEIIVLSEDPYFDNLLDYNDRNQNVNYENIEKLYNYLIEKTPDVLMTAYLFAKAYELSYNYRKNIDTKKLKEYLVKTDSRVANMAKKGRGNTFAKFLQVKPPIIKKMNSNYYRWNDDYPVKQSLNKIIELMNQNFEIPIPNNNVIKQLI